MARYRRRDPRWIHATCVVAAYLVSVAMVFSVQAGHAVTLPISVAVSAPPFVYAALSVVMLRRAPFLRRISWIGGACLTHALLGVLAAVVLMWAGGLPPMSAMAQVFVLFGPAPALTLVATPLVLARSGRTAPRTTSSAERPAPRRPGAPPRGRSRPFTRTAGSGNGEADAGVAPDPTIKQPPAAAVATPPSTTPMSSRADDVMIRISFERIAPQLPAEAFVLPLDRLGESLKEPHALLVPRRVVLAQMRAGGIAIDWLTVAAQFPALALGISVADFRSRYPDLKLSLPVDEVLAQLPPDMIPLASAVLATEDLHVPPRVTSLSNGHAPARSTPLAAPTAEPPPAPLPLVAAQEGRLDPETVARIVARFSGAGTFQSAAERVNGTTLVILVAPRLAREAVAACVARIVPFLAEGAGDVVTVRTTRAAVVLAGGPTPVVVAACRPGAPVALLELRATRAAVAVGEGAVTAPATPRRLLQPLTADGRVAGAGQALRSFGAVEPTVFADGGARVYVFSARGRDATPLGALALRVCEALREGDGELGRLVSVVFRRGRERTLVRPLGSGAGVLAATGPVTRPGRVHRDAERAAMMLEAL